MQILPRDIKQGKNDYLVTGQSNSDNKLLLIIFHITVHMNDMILKNKTNEGASTPSEDPYKHGYPPRLTKGPSQFTWRVIKNRTLTSFTRTRMLSMQGANAKTCFFACRGSIKVLLIKLK